jgi:hypothetical protein
MLIYEQSASSVKQGKRRVFAARTRREGCMESGTLAKSCMIALRQGAKSLHLQSEPSLVT